MNPRTSGASRRSLDARISAVAAAVNLLTCLIAIYAAVRFVVWTWVP